MNFMKASDYYAADFYMNKEAHFHQQNWPMDFIVESKRLYEAVVAFAQCWISQVWTTKSIHREEALCKGAFQNVFTVCDIMLRLVVLKSNKKNMLKPYHVPISSVFIQLSNVEPETSK